MPSLPQTSSAGDKLVNQKNSFSQVNTSLSLFTDQWGDMNLLGEYIESKQRAVGASVVVVVVDPSEKRCEVCWRRKLISETKGISAGARV